MASICHGTSPFEPLRPLHIPWMPHVAQGRTSLELCSPPSHPLHLSTSLSSIGIATLIGRDPAGSAQPILPLAPTATTVTGGLKAGTWITSTLTTNRTSYCFGRCIVCGDFAWFFAWMSLIVLCGMPWKHCRQFYGGRNLITSWTGRLSLASDGYFALATLLLCDR